MICGASIAAAQTPCSDIRAPIMVGTEWERYVRVLQIAGKVDFQPWTVRGFSSRQLRSLTPTDSTLPWHRSAKALCLGSSSVMLLTADAGAIYNSTFPYGGNDGAVWVGKGVTVAASAAGHGKLGPLTVTLSPAAFLTQNASFPIEPTGLTGERQYANWRYPNSIDLPQRFGNDAYGAIEPGQSTAEIDLRYVALGGSTANQFWGPASEHPILLGSNAAGFPHLYAQTAMPVVVPWFGRLHGRVFYGSLSQTRHSALAGSPDVRMASGLVGVFQPAFLPGVEIGGGRFFQTLMPSWRLTGTELARPFGVLFNSAAPETAGDQLVSLFGRAVFPGSGFEAYVEFGREDASADMRDFLLMADHDASYLLGVTKAWLRPGTVYSLRAEVLNTRITHLALSSTQLPWYVHDKVRQGFTNAGQAIGSHAAFGGGGSILAAERYDTTGLWRVSWERLQLAEYAPQRAPEMLRNDVAHVLGVDRLRFGRRANIEIGARLVYEINRYFRYDALNVRGSVRITSGAARAGPPS